MINKNEIRKLQNHFDYGIKDGVQAKVHYQIGDRVHLKGTKVNGVITGIIFKDDRAYPYLKIKWDSIPIEPENCKKFYDPFDIVKEIKKEEKRKKEKKVYVNFYLEEMKTKAEAKEVENGI